MNNSWDNLAMNRKALSDLLRIRDQADPASGVTLSVRRGVARDNPDYDDDTERRPWTTIELSNYSIVLNALIDQCKENIKMWECLVKKDIETATRILGEK